MNMLKITLSIFFTLLLLYGCGGSSSAIGLCDQQKWTDSTESVFNIANIDTEISKAQEKIEFVAVTSQPQPLSVPKPNYPAEIAKKYSGRNIIWTKLWLSKEGKVQIIKVRKCEPQELVPYVVEAAKNAVFSPAKYDSGNLEVWVSIPYLYP